MTNPLSKKSSDFFRTYPLWVATLLVFTFLLRLIEHIGATLQGPGGQASDLFYGLLNDAGFALSFAFVLCLPLLLAWCWKPRAALLLFLVCSSGYLLFSAALNRYYLATNTLLGADLFGYSIADIQTTVRSSTRFSFADLLPLLLLVLFVTAVRWIRKRSLQMFPWATSVLLLAGLGSTFRYNAFSAQQGTADAALSLNKCAYFVNANLAAGNADFAKITFAPYPLLRNDNSTDALTPFFDLKGQKPNLVFLIVEGLGRDFTGPSAAYGGFTPFLDSLSDHGLYWSNFLSSAGRSFAGLPSILGSLPFGKNGFTALGEDMPVHHSLISLLKKNGYHTSYFYGGNANFDGQDIFLERQGIDDILDETKFGPHYSREFGSKYSWGYADGDVYHHSLEVMKASPAKPLLNIYFTLSTHEPFAIPQQALYQEKVATRLAQLPVADRERFEPHKDVFQSLLYSDESIRSFLGAYRQRPDFANTIFIITGDHRLIPVPEDNLLSRFHVPLLIYSPLLKRQAVFPALSSHLDIAPSLVQLLRNSEGMQLPSQVHWMGKGLDTTKLLNTGYEMPLMRNKASLDDFISGNLFLSGNTLYRIGANLALEQLHDEKGKNRLQAKRDSFRQLNQYVSRENGLLKPGSGFVTQANHSTLFSPEEQAKLDSLTGDLTGADTLFSMARKLASSSQYVLSRLMCRKILSGSPNYHDVRVLLGRTYAWDQNYHMAAPQFAEVLRRSPLYEDAYLAWIDAAIWAEKKDSALVLAKKGLHYLPGSASLKEKIETLQARKKE